jgi:hypothetical protein
LEIKLENNLKDMQARHEKEIETLIKNCRHKWEYDKFPNGDTNLMRWVCTKCGELKSRPFTIKL